MISKKVMVIDDEADIRDGLTAALDFEGYQVLEAQNGKVAIEKLNGIPEQDLPGCIILDLMMPIMDGQTFLKEINANYPVLKKIPIILASANLRSAAEVAQTYSIINLAKPIDLDELYSAVKVHCRVP